MVKLIAHRNAEPGSLVWAQVGVNEFLSYTVVEVIDRFRFGAVCLCKRKITDRPLTDDERWFI